MYRFGPLNQEGGERRLNVTVTRAKNSMTVVSSFTHEDMDPGRSSARGVELLRLYLQYTASHGETIGERAHEIPELNAFEVDVRDALVREGIRVIAQYGASGFRIDFAAQHPTSPGMMVLAIECDGATYHSSETARDRDRLRQQILEGLGWTFHRIWSQDEREPAPEREPLAAQSPDHGGGAWRSIHLTVPSVGVPASELEFLRSSLGTGCVTRFARRS